MTTPAAAKWFRRLLIGLGLYATVALVFRLAPLLLHEDSPDHALLKAINAHDLIAVQRAFEDGATMTMAIRRNFTFLHVAAREGDVEIARLLVARGAAYSLAVRNDDGDSAMNIAYRNGHTQMVDYLRSLENLYGKPPVHP